MRGGSTFVAINVYAKLEQVTGEELFGSIRLQPLAVNHGTVHGAYVFDVDGRDARVSVGREYGVIAGYDRAVDVGVVGSR